MFNFGVDYYPEHWPEERWPEDARLMAEAGFNVVRLGEFAWSKFEPREGEYDFTWLDRAIAILAAQGIRILLGTPTASPPAWLMMKHPELYRVREDGLRATFGNRREYCPNHPLYHEYTQRIVTRMAEHYAPHPSIIGWQIDNEFGDRCYCPICARAFQDWALRRYESLDDLNAHWGTIFWSHTYGDWCEIPVPLTTGGSPNPGLALDFRRFMSDSYVVYQQLQLDILRQKCPKHFITHNFMGFHYGGLNYFDLARNLDLVGWDTYPRTQWEMVTDVDLSGIALSADAMRSLKHKNFWVIEQQAGPGGWEVVSVMPRPGELRIWAYQSIAHGADGVIFFRWRTARFGTEQYWHGLLDHNARPGRRYEEVKRMGAELKKAGDQILGSTVKASVAFISSYDSRFALEIQPNNPDLHYGHHLWQFYRAFYNRHIAIDVVSPTDDLSAYKLVIAPAVYVLPEAVANNLKRYVQDGGVLILSPRSGVKDEFNAIVNLPLPGLLAEVCGIRVDDYDSLPHEVSQSLEFVPPSLATIHPPSARVWCDILALEGAEVIARYTRDYYAGKPAITLNRFGKGLAVYVGTVGDQLLHEMLSGWLLDLAGVRRMITAPAGVEVAERWQGEHRILFLLNQTERTQEVTLDGRYNNLIGDPATLEGTVTIPPRDVLVLMEGRAA
jgi:beta-galactosidase